MKLNPTEQQLLIGFLEELSDRFANDGCNDFFLKDTPETRKIAEAAHNEAFPHAVGSKGHPDSFDLEGSIEPDGTIGCCNFTILDLLIAKLKKAIGSIQ